ncbi:Na+/H+ antiporter NhaC family protein [Ectopseudomonas khazarica]|uniref:Na+/H+ antiporter NhaC family protein n=1 Tax=Ectopseudomonas khazarica TaxID=2502979 RepID=UPI002FE0DBD8
MSQAKTIKKPTLSFALITLASLVLFIVVSLVTLKLPILIVLFSSWLFLGLFALRLGYSIKEIEGTIYEMLKSGVGVFALLLSIGCMVAIWLCAGTIPTLTYWGLSLVTPQMFLVVAFSLCTVVSMATGSSWGTMSTAGVAMLGVGIGLGIDPAIVVGATVSGAHVGNSLSPTADNCLLASSTSKVDLMVLVKHNAKLIIPAALITALMYMFFGFTYVNSEMDPSIITGLLNDLHHVMKLNIFTLLPLAVIVTLLVMRKPALTAIFVGNLVGLLIAVFYQGFSVAEVGNYMANGFAISTGNPYLDPILNRGGISSMLSLLSMIIASLGMGGILKGTQILDVIVESFSKLIQGRMGLTTASTLGCTLCLGVVSTNYFSIILNCTLLTPLYVKMGYKPENATRIINDLSACMATFVPWGLAGLFISATFNIDLVSVIPYMFFNIVASMLCVVYGYTGFTMTKLRSDKPQEHQTVAAAHH